MREIKYRGFSLGSRKWVYGFYYSTVFSEEFKKEFKIKKDVAHYIYKGHVDSSPKEVDPLTVGQYTGLKDKNGVEIFEGDIMGKGVLRCVVEQQPDGAYVLRFIDAKMKGQMISILDPKVSNSEITGNIHSNPELLK
ncbi:YopX family protein [Chryseobacterium indologenes]|uniref:YopX protein domain-containing protein n=1 Tax=Chryseobacterium indologenes TaxID=253 RepID=A0A0N0ZV78_CHRID|nr:YopX family protein [Chryseobacterium indologenes]KPE51008.1 hypothetical protein AOB46_12540 [Chryseobacterium indologenes]